MSTEGDPPHPIIQRPWEYQVIGFNYQIPIDETPAFIDLTLAKGPVLRRLRFLWPRDLTIERGFPTQTGGLEILDVTGRQMEGVGVRVHDFEATPGAVEFWAAEVLDLDTMPSGAA